MSGPATRYSDTVRALFRALDGAGDLPPAPGIAVSAEAIALDRGAWVRFSARIEAGRIADCRFRAFGCPHTLAAASFAAGRLLGAPVDAPLSIDAAALARALDVPAEKRGRLLVVEDALRSLAAAARGVQ